MKITAEYIGWHHPEIIQQFLAEAIVKWKLFVVKYDNNIQLQNEWRNELLSSADKGTKDMGELWTLPHV